MSIPRILYLVLAVAGVVMTWYYNLQYMQESGGSFDLAAFMAAARYQCRLQITELGPDDRLPGRTAVDFLRVQATGITFLLDLHHPRVWRRLCLCVSAVSVRAPGKTGIHAE